MPEYKFLKVGHYTEGPGKPVIQIHVGGEVHDINDVFAARCEKFGWAEATDAGDTSEGREVPDAILQVDGEGNPLTSQESDEQPLGFLDRMFGSDPPEGSGDGDED